MAEKIVVEFSGYMVLDDNTMFMRVSDSVDPRSFITAKQWLALDDEYKNEYAIHSMEHAMSDAQELGWNHSDIIVEDESVKVYSTRTYHVCHRRMR